METQLPSPKGAHPQIFGHVCCGQTDGMIKMQLGTKVGLDLGHIVLDMDPAPPSPQGYSPLIFGPCLLRRNGWMDQQTTWQGGRPRPWPHCVRWGPTSPPQRGTALNFRPISIVAKWPPISATAEHLLQIKILTKMWAIAQRDRRPVEYRWRPLFSAVKYG